MERDWEYDFRPVDFKDEGDKDCCELMRAAFQDLATKLQNNLPDGRYKAIVKTKLEEAAMFTTKAFTHR